MGVFCVLLFVPIVMQHVVVKQSHVAYEKKNKRALTVFFIFFTLLVMLRHESVGNDTRNYMYFFKRFSEMSWRDIGKIPWSLDFPISTKSFPCVLRTHSFSLPLRQSPIAC